MDSPITGEGNTSALRAFSFVAFKQSFRGPAERISPSPSSAGPWNLARQREARARQRRGSPPSEQPDQREGRLWRAPAAALSPRAAVGGNCPADSPRFPSPASGRRGTPVTYGSLRREATVAAKCLARRRFPGPFARIGTPPRARYSASHRAAGGGGGGGPPRHATPPIEPRSLAKRRRRRPGSPGAAPSFHHPDPPPVTTWGSGP